MKLITSILFSLILLAPNLSKTYIFLDFKLNQDFIAKELCVQKNIENNCCKGSCQLSKRLKSSDKENSEKLPQKYTTIAEQILYIYDKFYTKNLQFSYIKKDIIQQHISFTSFDYSNGVFRPPQV